MTDRNLPEWMSNNESTALKQVKRCTYLFPPSDVFWCSVIYNNCKYYSMNFSIYYSLHPSQQQFEAGLSRCGNLPIPGGSLICLSLPKHLSREGSYSNTYHYQRTVFHNLFQCSLFCVHIAPSVRYSLLNNNWLLWVILAFKNFGKVELLHHMLFKKSNAMS